MLSGLIIGPAASTRTGTIKLLIKRRDLPAIHDGICLALLQVRHARCVVVTASTEHGACEARGLEELARQAEVNGVSGGAEPTVTLQVSSEARAEEKRASKLVRHHLSESAQPKEQLSLGGECLSCHALFAG